MYSGTRTFCLFDRGKTRKSVYRWEYAFSLLPLNLVQFGFYTNLVRFRFVSLDEPSALMGSELGFRGLDFWVEG